MRLYLGYDGAYVLSRYKLTVHNDGECDFLSTAKTNSIVDVGCSGILFGKLKLKMYEVVKLDVKVKRRRK